jgi:hypothetical protein
MTGPKAASRLLAICICLAEVASAAASEGKVKIELGMRRVARGQRMAKAAPEHRIGLHTDGSLAYIRIGSSWRKLPTAVEKMSPGLAVIAHIPALRLKLALARSSTAEPWLAQVIQVTHVDYEPTGRRANLNPALTVVRSSGLLNDEQREVLVEQVGEDLGPAYRQHRGTPLQFDHEGARVVDAEAGADNWLERMVAVFRDLTLGDEPVEFIVPTHQYEYHLQVQLLRD